MILISNYYVIFIFMFQWNVFQYPFQRRVIKAVQFLRETGRKVIEVRKNAMRKGEEVPDDILQHIIQQQGLQYPLLISFATMCQIRSLQSTP